MTRFLSVFFASSLLCSSIFSAHAASSNATASFNMSDFAWKRVPNLEEVLIDASGLSILDSLLQSYIEELKKDPAAGAVLRDAMKVIPTIIKAIHGVQVGGTEYFYGRDHVYSQCLKVITKLIQIIGLTAGGLEQGTAGHVANYFSDTLSRAIILAGQEWQDSKKAISFEDYFFTHLDWKWFGGAFLEASPKIALNDILSIYLIKNTNLLELVRTKVFIGINYLFSTKQNYEEPFWMNSKQNIGPSTGYLRTLSAYAFSFASTAASFFVFNVVTTYVLAPPARIIMDGINHAHKYYANLWKNTFKKEDL